MPHTMELFPAQFDWKSAPFSTAYHPVIAIVIYLSTIFGLRWLMKDRPPIKMRYLIFLHNVFLCALSAAMAAGIFLEIGRLLFFPPKTLPVSPFREVLCDTTGQSMSGRTGWWLYIFYVSKYYELVDTLIMVLSKRRLNFLHVYHHCIVLPLFYVYMSTHMVLQWIIVVANCLVHVAMYYYYAMAALGFKVWWKKYITMTQIIQFIIDLTSTWPYPVLYSSQTGCSGGMRAWLFGQAVGFSFFKLFSDFYVKSYSSSRKVIPSDAQTNVTSSKQVNDTDRPKSL